MRLSLRGGQKLSRRRSARADIPAGTTPCEPRPPEVRLVPGASACVDEEIVHPVIRDARTRGGRPAHVEQHDASLVEPRKQHAAQQGADAGWRIAIEDQHARKGTAESGLADMHPDVAILTEVQRNLPTTAAQGDEEV